MPSSATETGNWMHKNVIDRQHSARFQKSPKSAISLHPTEQENPKSRRKTYTVKPVEHGGRGERDRYSWGVVVRDSAPWETVKPINVAVKKKTELFSSTLILPTRYVQYDTSSGQHCNPMYSLWHIWLFLQKYIILYIFSFHSTIF